MLNSFQHPSCHKDKLPQVERWAPEQVRGDDERASFDQSGNKKRTFLHTPYCGLSCRMTHQAPITPAAPDDGADPKLLHGPR